MSTPITRAVARLSKNKDHSRQQKTFVSRLLADIANIVPAVLVPLICFLAVQIAITLYAVNLPTGTARFDSYVRLVSGPLVSLVFALTTTWLMLNSVRNSYRTPAIQASIFALVVAAASLFAVLYIAPPLVYTDFLICLGIPLLASLVVARIESHSRDDRYACSDTADRLRAVQSYVALTTTLLDGLPDHIVAATLLAAPISAPDGRKTYAVVSRSVDLPSTTTNSDKPDSVSDQHWAGDSVDAVATARTLHLLSKASDKSAGRMHVETQTALAAPLTNWEERLEGILIIESTRGPYTWRTNLGSYRMLADRVALQHQILELSKRNRILGQDSGRVAESARWAAEVHDTIAQSYPVIINAVYTHQRLRGTYTSGALQLQEQQLEIIREVSEKNLAQVRALIANSDEVLGVPPLDSTLEGIAEDLRRTAEIEVRVMIQTSEIKLDQDKTHTLSRCALEAANNIRKHARATSAQIELDNSHDSVRLTITDDGRGLDSRSESMSAQANETQDYPMSGQGLALMRSRVAKHSGRLVVRNSPGGVGTQITVDLPTNEHNGEGE